MTVRLLALSTTLLCVTGCEPAADAPAPAPATDSSVADAPIADAPESSYEVIQVTSRGLTVIGSDGVSTAVGIGTAEAEALAALARTLGAPNEDGAYEECGADAGMRHVSWANGLRLNIGSDGTVAGWEAEGDDERIQTETGVQLGAPMDMAQASDPSMTMVEASTLEHEFSVGEPDAEGNTVGGILSGEGGTVHHLYAGANCFMR